MGDAYWSKVYQTEVTTSNDSLRLDKSAGSDWSHLNMITNGSLNGSITIRSKQQAEQLYFSLGQLLDK